MPKLPSIPGFTAVSDQVLVREPSASDGPAPAPLPAGHPGTVLVYGWGDGLPKHVAKYADGFRVLYPHTRQVVILSPISKALFSDLQKRSEAMLPVIKAIWPDGPPAEDTPGPTVLAHTMSNTGAVNYAATLYAFRQLYDRALPHQLLVMDSTPGSTDVTGANLVRWSRAMALGTAAWFPWPFVVTQSIWAVALAINGFYEWLIGRKSAGAWSRVAANDTTYELKSARKMYIYSKEDDLIGWEDIELHVAETRKLGWTADVEVFDGSGHVGHMRKAPEQYWKAIMESWERAIKAEQ